MILSTHLASWPLPQRTHNSLTCSPCFSFHVLIAGGKSFPTGTTVKGCLNTSPGTYLSLRVTISKLMGDRVTGGQGDRVTYMFDGLNLAFS